MNNTHSLACVYLAGGRKGKGKKARKGKERGGIFPFSRLVFFYFPGGKELPLLYALSYLLFFFSYRRGRKINEYMV